MRIALQIVSWIALAATVLPAVAFLAGRIELPQAKTAILAATIVWFATAPLWVGRKEANSG